MWLATGRRVCRFLTEVFDTCGLLQRDSSADYCYSCLGSAIKAIDKVVKLRKQTLDGNVETLLLAILEREPNYGYAVSKELNDFSHGILQLGESTIYVVLHRMQKKALISAKWSTAQNGRRRKYYHLTNKGHRSLEAGLQQWRTLSAIMEAVFGCV
jgi:PadR family transcriptional regulator PadR